MTACSRRNFVSGMGALILMTGTSVTSLAKEEKADKPKRYAMVHDETACIGCTACMDACRETNHVPEGVSRLEILRSEPYGEFPNQEYEFFRQSCQHCTNALVWQFVQPVHHLLILKQVSSMCIKIFV